MSAQIEYHDAMIHLLELIWGEGYMAPGGSHLVDRLVQGLQLRGRRVLDIGSGLGGPCCHLALQHGAVATGIDIEPQLVSLANDRARRLGLQDSCRFVLVEPGPLPFDDADWYRHDVRREYEQMKGPLYQQMEALLGSADADHFVEDWRSMVVVFEKGELTQTICRARKAG